MKRACLPRSRGLPGGRIGQPFYGWFTCDDNSAEAALAAFDVAMRSKGR
jgi:hypothetical protein